MFLYWPKLKYYLLDPQPRVKMDAERKIDILFELSSK
jgi:hypothetical protein